MLRRDEGRGRLVGDGPGEAVSACPTEDEWSAFASDTLAHDRRAALADHASTCPPCRALVSALIVTEAANGTDAGHRRRSVHVAAGTRIDRYVVDRVLGVGGMGVVYVAHDPELDRDVAIKLLSGGGSADRLRREAQALAKLHHPNVVPVYDAGECDGRSFVAMALVDGNHLRAWCSGERSTAEILGAIAAAGRGLAAAHAAGLIHRDLKPDNIFISQRGEVMVGDFGLARFGDQPAEVSAVDPADAAIELTRSGMVIGTPAYMAPEQARGEATALSDQFGLCVTAWEALYGVRPFAGRSMAEIFEAVARGAITEPAAGRKVPARIRRALIRGMAADPKARWPTVAALLAELTGERVRRRRAVVLGAGAVAAVVAAGAGFAARAGDHAAPPCRSADERLAGTWTAGTRDRLRTALIGAAPYAQTAIEGALAGLDRYAARWRRSWDETCASARPEGAAVGFDLRIACLDQRLHALEAVVEVLRVAEPRTARDALEIARGMPAIDPCDDPVALRKVAPPAPAAAGQIAAIEATLARVDALQKAGKYPVALALAGDAEREAGAIGYLPTVAHAGIGMATVLDRLQRYPDARARLEAALNPAIAGGDDRAMAQIYLLLAGNATAVHDPKQARTRLATAEAALSRIGEPPELRNLLARAAFVATYQEGRFAEALAQIDALIPRLVSEGDRAVDLPPLYYMRGQMLFGQDRVPEALASIDQAVSVAAAAFGTKHPTYAGWLGKRANFRVTQDDFAGAIADLEQAYAILVETLGPDSAETIAVEELLADKDLVDGRFDLAIAKLRHVLAIRERVSGDEATAYARRHLADMLVRARQLDEAQAELDHALALDRAHGNWQVGWDTLSLAGVQLARGHLDQALSLAETARVGLEKTFKRPQLYDCWVVLGQIRLARGELREAVNVLGLVTQGFPFAEARTYLALALARLGDRAGAEAARAAALAALDRMDGTGTRSDLRAQLVRLGPDRARRR